MYSECIALSISDTYHSAGTARGYGDDNEHQLHTFLLAAPRTNFASLQGPGLVAVTLCVWLLSVSFNAAGVPARCGHL